MARSVRHVELPETVTVGHERKKKKKKCFTAPGRPAYYPHESWGVYEVANTV
jgi:hypothetical protein